MAASKSASRPLQTYKGGRKTLGDGDSAEPFSVLFRPRPCSETVSKFRDGAQVTASDGTVHAKTEAGPEERRQAQGPRTLRWELGLPPETAALPKPPPRLWQNGGRAEHGPPAGSLLRSDGAYGNDRRRLFFKRHDADPREEGKCFMKPTTV